jgi:hypothetical protein
MTRVLQVR